MSGSRSAGDNSWLMSNAFIIFTMQAGFGMLEAGMVSVKSTSNILMKNLGDLAFGSVAFFMMGYAFAFGDGDGFAGSSHFFLNKFRDFPNWVFQLAFAATASTILSGAVASRMKFSMYLCVSFFVTGFAYPLAARWAWYEDGWLNKMGYLDFAGCGPIHLLGGSMGMVGTFLLGPRLGVFSSSGEYIPKRSSPVHTLFGTFILWWGWFAFNAGSTTSISDGNDLIAGLAATNTGIASGAATVTTIGLCLIHSKGRTVDVFETTAGTLGGLVAITAGCAFLEPYEAFLVGVGSAPVVYFASRIPIHFRLDDPVGVFPVHVAAACYGLLCLGLLHPDVGVLHGGGFKALGVQLLGIVVYAAWGVSTMFAILLPAEYLMGLRVGAMGEKQGLDETEHGIVTMKLMATDGARGQRSSLVRESQENMFFTKAEVSHATLKYNMSRGSTVSLSPTPRTGRLKAKPWARRKRSMRKIVVPDTRKAKVVPAGTSAAQAGSEQGASRRSSSASAILAGAELHDASPSPEGSDAGATVRSRRRSSGGGSGCGPSAGAGQGASPRVAPEGVPTLTQTPKF